MSEESEKKESADLVKALLKRQTQILKQLEDQKLSEEEKLDLEDEFDRNESEILPNIDEISFVEFASPDRVGTIKKYFPSYETRNNRTHENNMIHAMRTWNKYNKAKEKNN